MWKIHSYPSSVPTGAIYQFGSTSLLLSKGLTLLCVVLLEKKQHFLLPRVHRSCCAPVFCEKAVLGSWCTFFFCQRAASTSRTQLNHDAFFFPLKGREAHIHPFVVLLSYPPLHTCIQAACTGGQQLRDFCAALNTGAVVAWVPLPALSPMSEPPSGAEATQAVNFWPSAANF